MGLLNMVINLIKTPFVHVVVNVLVNIQMLINNTINQHNSSYTQLYKK